MTKDERLALADRISDARDLDCMDEPHLPEMTTYERDLIIRALRQSSDRDAVVEECASALNKIAPAVENLACHQVQCDEDGVMVQVSRQAVDEVVNAINQIAINLNAAIRALKGQKA